MSIPKLTSIFALCLVSLTSLSLSAACEGCNLERREVRTDYVRVYAGCESCGACASCVTNDYELYPRYRTNLDWDHTSVAVIQPVYEVRFDRQTSVPATTPMSAEFRTQAGVAVRDLTPGYAPDAAHEARVEENRARRLERREAALNYYRNRERRLTDEAQSFDVRYDAEVPMAPEPRPVSQWSTPDEPSIGAERRAARMNETPIEVRSTGEAIREASRAQMRNDLPSGTRADTGFKPGLQPNKEQPAIFNATGPQGAVPQISTTPLDKTLNTGSSENARRLDTIENRSSGTQTRNASANSGQSNTSSGGASNTGVSGTTTTTSTGAQSSPNQNTGGANVEGGTPSSR